MPIRFGYDESFPENWNNTGDTYNGPGIASNMQSFGMNGSPYSALVPQGQANPFAGTLAMNPGATDTNNFGDWASQYSQSPPSAGNTPLISSPALTGGGQRPASVGGTGGYDPNWQSLLTPWNTTNPSAANDPDAWVRQLDQNSYYKYILPYQQRGGNTRDIAAMTKLIEDGLARDGGGQWNQGGQVKNVAGPKLDYLNDPNAYGNQNRGGYSSPAATQPGTTGQPTQNGSVGGGGTPPGMTPSWMNQPQVDPAAAYGGGIDQMLRAFQARNSQPAMVNAGGWSGFQPGLSEQLDTRGYGDGNRIGRIDNMSMRGRGINPNQFYDVPGENPSTWGGGGTQRFYAPGSMEERYAAMYGGGGNYQSRYPSASSGMQGIGEVPSYNPFGSGPPPNYASGGEATGGMDQPWNQGGASGTTRPGYINTGYDQRGYNGPLETMPSSEGRPATFQDLQNFYNSGGQNPNFDLTSLFQQYMGGGNGGQVSGYGGLPASWSGVATNGANQQQQQFSATYGGAPGSMQQRNQAYFQNPGAAFGSAAAGGGTSNSNGSGSAGPTPVMASPSFGFGSATGRRTGYGNQNSYYGGSSNPNSFGGSNFGNYSYGGSLPGYATSGERGGNNYSSANVNTNPSSGFAAGRTGRPSSFTF